MIFEPQILSYVSYAQRRGYADLGDFPFPHSPLCAVPWTLEGSALDVREAWKFVMGRGKLLTLLPSHCTNGSTMGSNPMFPMRVASDKNTKQKRAFKFKFLPTHPHPSTNTFHDSYISQLLFPWFCHIHYLCMLYMHRNELSSTWSAS